MYLTTLTNLIKKNGAGIVALGIVFMMVYSWFPKMERTLQTAIDKVNGTMTEVTREFRSELREQRQEATKERALMWELLRAREYQTSPQPPVDISEAVRPSGSPSQP